MEVQEVVFGGRWEKITWVAGSRKMVARRAVERRGMEKSKNDFPTPLGNPANPRGIPTFPTASAAARD